MWKLLPADLREELTCMREGDKISEVHLRVERCASVTVGGENRRLSYQAAPGALDEILHAACGGSIYAYRDNIRAGYITLAGGVRMGLVGRAVTEGDKVVAVTEVSSLCFRIPHRVAGVSEEVYRMWNEDGGRGGILVLAPPACGKTTFLRDFISRASSGRDARRVAVVDTREELCTDESGEMVDVLRGYPRAAGLEIALRTMSPEVLVSDEIGGEDVLSVRDALYGGVPLVAAMHGSSLTEVAHRSGVRALLDSGVFSFAVTLAGAAGGWQSTVVTLSC